MCPSDRSGHAARQVVLLLWIAATAICTSEARANQTTPTVAQLMTAATVPSGSGLEQYSSRSTLSARWTAHARDARLHPQSSITSSLTVAIRSCSGIGRTGKLDVSGTTIERLRQRTAGSAAYVHLLGTGRGHQISMARTPPDRSQSFRASPQVSLRGVRAGHPATRTADRPRPATQRGS